MKNQDSSQKDILCRHFSAQGWYVQPEVLVFHRGGIHESKKPLTDVDVLALRPGADLRWELVLGDCKTLRGQSPVNRAIWLRGLMEHFSASSGVVMLRREQPMETDHKLFAASLRVNLVRESEFQYYDRAIVYPYGTADCPLSLEKLTSLHTVWRRYPGLRPLCEYIYQFSWNETTRLGLLRKVIGESQAVAREIDPDKPEHLALVLDAAGVFAVGLAECVGIIFNQYLHPGTLNQLDDALKVVIWGGRSQYDFIARLRHDLLVAKGKTPGPSGALSLPVWDQFLQLVRNMLEFPSMAFRVPHLLQNAAVDAYHNQSFLSIATEADLLLLKYAMLTTEYLCRAANFPPQTRASLADAFIRRQSDLVHSDKVRTEQAEQITKQPGETPHYHQLAVDDLEESTT